MKRRIILIALLAMPLSMPLRAQRPGAAGVDLIERLNRMSPAERHKVLNRMPPERRDILERRISNLNNIRPELREKLKRDYEHFQQLPPEKQTEVRHTLRQIAELPEDRRRQVRAAINRLRQQTPEVQQRRIASRNFQDRFNDDERKLVEDALAMLPPPEPAPIEP